MTHSRRRVLQSLTLAGAALAGCVSTPGADRDATDEPQSPGAAPTATASTATPDDAATGTGTATARQEPIRPDGDPVTIERTITDPDLDYLPDEHAVKYPAYYKRVGTPGDGPPTRTTIYETTPFEDWAVTECASAGAKKVGSVVRSAVDGDPNLSVGITTRDDEMAISARQTTTKNREGEVVSEPTVPFDRVVAVTPRAVTATVHLDDQSHTATIPVWADEMTMHYD
ncbi:hypothetical protein ACFR9U_12065 [Halorientalis brevis]|uniref:Uncharacterized protein n=1 Tax=Halorientalis brevis TaxID=1126241 RepID=A0ABD6CCG6_9EURY|nr:hypothetical protein [Halorientalis brevis]